MTLHPILEEGVQPPHMNFSTCTSYQYVCATGSGTRREVGMETGTSRQLVFAIGIGNNDVLDAEETVWVLECVLDLVKYSGLSIKYVDSKKHRIKEEVFLYSYTCL